MCLTINNVMTVKNDSKNLCSNGSIMYFFTNYIFWKLFEFLYYNTNFIIFVSEM